MPYFITNVLFVSGFSVKIKQIDGKAFVDRISLFEKTLKNPRFSADDPVHEVLFEAARTNEMKYIDWLLSENVQKNLRAKTPIDQEIDYNTSTVLLRACWFGADKVLRWLFSQTHFQKPDTNEKSLMGSGMQNAFMCCLVRSHPDCLDILFEQGKNLNVAAGEVGFTRLLLSPRITYILLKNNAYHMLPDSQKKTIEVVSNWSKYGTRADTKSVRDFLDKSVGMIIKTSPLAYKNDVLSSLIQSRSLGGAQAVFGFMTPEEKTQFCRKFKNDHQDCVGDQEGLGEGYCGDPGHAPKKCFTKTPFKFQDLKKFFKKSFFWKNLKRLSNKKPPRLFLAKCNNPLFHLTNQKVHHASQCSHAKRQGFFGAFGKRRIA